MSALAWAPALVWTTGIVILILALIVIWPRRSDLRLRQPDYRVGRDCYREMVK